MRKPIVAVMAGLAIVAATNNATSEPAQAQISRTMGIVLGLRDLGYEEGRSIAIDYRWAEGMYERFPVLIAELIGLNVDVIVTAGTPAALAVKTVMSAPE
jgi:ABC-type uncharacterized transport system substrate-binding protein